MSTQSNTVGSDVSTVVQWPVGIDPRPYREALESAQADPAYLDAIICDWMGEAGAGEFTPEQLVPTFGAQVLETLANCVRVRERLPVLRKGLDAKRVTMTPHEPEEDEDPGKVCVVEFRCPACGRDLAMFEDPQQDPSMLGSVTFLHLASATGCPAIPRDARTERVPVAAVLTALDIQPMGLDANMDLDWDRAYQEVDLEADPDWLIPGVMARGELVTLFGASGGRKSLLVAYWCLQAVRAGINVRYLDRENRWQETVRRLKKMGATPTDLQRFHYRTMADALVDTPAGQEAVLDAAQGMDLVVFDSWARFFLAGNQSDDKPANEAYNGLLLPLRGRGVAVLRIDHSGVKDTSRPMGTIVKTNDADHLWMVTTTGERTTLTHAKNRTNQQGAKVLTLNWLEGPLRVEQASAASKAAQAAQDVEESGGTEKVEACVKALDLLNVDESLGRDAAKALLVEGGYSGRKAGFSADILSKAINARRTRADGAPQG